MKINLTKFAVMPLCVLATACATNGPDNSIEMAARPMVQSMDGKMHIPQSEMKVDIHVSNMGATSAAAAAGVPGIGVLLAAGAGAAGATMDAKINAERQKSAEKKVDPLRDTLVGYNYGEVLHEKVLADIKNIDWLNVTDVELDQSSSILPEDREKEFTASQASAFMNINMDYAITADLTDVEVDALVQIFPKTEDLSAYKHTLKQSKASLEKNTEIGDTIFYRTFKVSVPLPGMENVDHADRKNLPKVDADTMAAIDRESLIAKLDQAATEMAAEIAAAINDPELPKKKK